MGSFGIDIMIEEIEQALSGKSRCTRCNKIIPQGEWRGVSHYCARNFTGVNYFCRDCTVEELKKDIENSQELLNKLSQGR